MNVSQTKAEGLVREYAIVITADEIDKEVAVKLSELAKTVKMPGFRPGKVPMSVVKSRFGPQVQGDAIKTALDEGARQAIEGNDLRLASQPSVDIKEYEEGKDLTASLTCEVMPDITVPDLSSSKSRSPLLKRVMQRLTRRCQTLPRATGQVLKSKRAAQPRMVTFWSSTSLVELTVRHLKAVRRTGMRWNLVQTASFPALKTV
jgi:trigger factor